MCASSKSVDQTKSVVWTTGIAVVIPCYRVTSHIQSVIQKVGPRVDRIYCVDDACPDGSGNYIESNIVDPRVCVLRNLKNLGVGGAVMAGYRQAVHDGAKIIVKIDGDDQMDPGLLMKFVDPITKGEADYTKGNRFWDLRQISQMPLSRRIGNLGLSFLAKASGGYWSNFDPTNGYTAISAKVVAILPYDSISNRYFFETDMLFRLNIVRAVVVDIPMDARYGDEVSGLRVSKVLPEFLAKHMRNLIKRILYNYYLRDLSIASLELIAALSLLSFALGFGGYHWIHSYSTGLPSAIGTVIIPTIAVVSGLQFLLAFVGYDIANVPTRPLHPLLDDSLSHTRELEEQEHIEEDGSASSGGP